MLNWQEYIVSDPKVLLGKPVIKGTRISVEFYIRTASRRLDDKGYIGKLSETY